VDEEETGEWGMTVCSFVWACAERVGVEGIKCGSFIWSRQHGGTSATRYGGELERVVFCYSYGGVIVRGERYTLCAFACLLGWLLELFVLFCLMLARSFAGFCCVCFCLLSLSVIVSSAIQWSSRFLSYLW